MSLQCNLCGSSARKLSFNRDHKGKNWEVAVCNSCGLHFTHPIPTDADIANFYGGNYHEEIRDHSAGESAQRENYSRYTSMLGRHLTRGKVVDIGCSTGLFVQMLCEKGYAAEGVEIDVNSAEWGRRNYGITIHATALDQCPYEEGSLDAIALMDVLEHMQNPLAFLTEIKSLLRTGGIALISFPDVRSLESRYWHFLSRLFRRNWLWHNCHIPLHVWEFTKPTATAMFRKAGFQVEEFKRSQPQLETANEFLVKLLRLPTLPLYVGPMKKLFGSQMEFVIRKL